MYDDRPLIWKISNGDISATGHPIHFMFGSKVGFTPGRRIEWRYFRFDQSSKIQMVMSPPWVIWSTSSLFRE